MRDKWHTKDWGQMVQVSQIKPRELFTSETGYGTS